MSNIIEMKSICKSFGAVKALKNIDFAGAKRDFAVRSGLIPKASLFSNEELTEIYRATDHLLAEDSNLNDKQIRAIQEARIKIEFSVPDLDPQLEHRQDYSPQMEM